MDLWRICRAKHEAVALTGDDAAKTGGRWNAKGSPMVYASENLSLAALELFVHVSPGIIPNDLISIQYQLPDTISAIELVESNLPKNWRNYPAPVQLQTLGTDWLRGATSLVLIVPSAINPLERNILLNPMHSDIKKIKALRRQTFHFDSRMFGK